MMERYWICFLFIVNIKSVIFYQRLYVPFNRITSINSRYTLQTISSTIQNVIEINTFEIISYEDDQIEKLSIGKDSDYQNKVPSNVIILKNIKNGWGDGKHPTTKLCLDFLTEHMKPGMNFLDYGTGSGILSVYAAKLGANLCLGVEVDESAIETANGNKILNHVENIVDITHTARIYIGNEDFPTFDISIANILPGPLTKLVGILWGLTKPGGLLCLSGMRPNQLDAVKRFYEPFVNMTTEKMEIEAHPQYGEWIRWSVNTKVMTIEEKKDALSIINDLASR